MKNLVMLLSVVVFTSIAQPSIAAVSEDSRKISRQKSNNVSVEIHIKERVSLQELIEHSAAVYSELGRPDTVWIGYFVPDQSGGGAWALTSRNFNKSFLEPKEIDKLITRIDGFTKDDWNAFGRDGLMYPANADLVGLWKFYIHGYGDVEISIFSQNGQEYLYKRFADGSGVPTPIVSVSDPSGRVLREPFDEEEKTYWLLKKSGTLERHDKEGLIPGWEGDNTASSQTKNDPEAICEIREVFLKRDIMIDDHGEMGWVNHASIKIYTNAQASKDYIAISKDVVSQIQAIKSNLDDIEVRFTDKVGTTTLFAISYTPKPSRLVYRDNIWNAAGIPDIASRIDLAIPKTVCVVKRL